MPAVVEILEGRRLLATFPPGFFQTPVSGDVALGSAIAIAPDGKLFVVEQAGQIQVYSSFASPNQLLQSNFFRDDPPSVHLDEERGLFSIAFDPDYLNNRHVYVHYTRAGFPFPSWIVRYTADAAGELALAGSATLLLEIGPATTQIHNGGAMHFGPDGKLYLGIGDNGLAAHSQSIDTLKGKILRMNVTPGDVIPPDNPTSIDGIAGTPAGINRLIWAAGLRNPYTFAFQPGTGRMFINDVGAVSWEEINDGAPGRNFGWPDTEGDFDPQSFPSFTRPFFAYHHSAGPVVGKAIVGGAFYDPPVSTFPTDYAGDYFFGDFFPGWIKRIDQQTKQVSDFADDTGLITDIRVAPDGSLLYLTHDATAGRAYRVQFDDIAPHVNGGEFIFDGFTLPDAPHRLLFTFTENVSASLDPADLTLLNTTTGQPVPSSAITVGWDAASLTARFTFPGFANGILPDGQYLATLHAAGVTDPAGNALAADRELAFRVLAGDANNDGAVNLADFNILATNFGTTSKPFSQGNFDYDPAGNVNLADFNILAGKFGSVVARRVPVSAGTRGGERPDDYAENALALLLA